MSYLRKKTIALIGLFLVFYGIILILLPEKLLIYSIYFVGAIISIISFIDIIIHIGKIKDRLYLLGAFTIGLIMYRFPYFNLRVLIRLFGVFSLIEFLSMVITFIQCVINRVKWRFVIFIDCIIFLILGLGSLIFTREIIPQLSIYLGIYLILIGCRFLRDGFEQLFGVRHGENIKRRLRTSLPLLHSSIIPKVVLIQIEKALQEKKNIDVIKEDVEPDIEIMVHTAPAGHNMMGHVDMAIGNIVITYGNYDFSSYRFFDSIGDGVITVAPKKEYIQFSQSYLDKTLVGFGLKLTDEQKQRVDERLMEIFSNVDSWAPRAKRDPEHQDEYNEYSSMVYKATKAQYYKPKSGRFKSFFIFTTNCCLFADSILGRIGTDVINLSGILTPGNYYDYFNTEFEKKNSMVVSRKVYYMAKDARKEHLKRIGLKKHGTK